MSCCCVFRNQNCLQQPDVFPNLTTRAGHSVLPVITFDLDAPAAFTPNSQSAPGAAWQLCQHPEATPALNKPSTRPIVPLSPTTTAPPPAGMTAPPG